MTLMVYELIQRILIAAGLLVASTVSAAINI
jgi:hypothetical protein